MAKWPDIDHVVAIFALTAFVTVLFAAYMMANSGWTVFKEVTAVLAMVSFLSILVGLYKAARLVWSGTGSAMFSQMRRKESVTCPPVAVWPQ